MMAGSGTVARFVVLFVVVLILQVAVMPQITLLNVVIDLLAATAVVSGMNGGAEKGVVIGFSAGLISDLLAHTPFGLITMVLTLAGYAAGTLAVQVANSGIVMRAAIAGGLAASTVLVFVAIAWLIDLAYVTESGVLRIAIVNGAIVALINPLSERVVRWSLRITPNQNLREASLRETSLRGTG